jgi:hypothetical protein
MSATNMEALKGWFDAALPGLEGWLQAVIDELEKLAANLLLI